MSERAERRGGGERRGRGRPGAVHDRIIGMIYDIVEERLEDRLPTLGEVRGVDGGRVRVWIDEEDEERSIGFPRKLGQRYRVGDRVLLVPSRSGEWAVAGTISAAGGAAAQAVGDEELVDNGISGGKLRGNAVTSRELAGGAVLAGHLAERNVTRSKLAENAVSAFELAGGAVTGGHIANGAVGTTQLANGAVTGAKLANGAVGPAQLAGGAVTRAIIAADAVSETELAPAVRTKLNSAGITLPLDSGNVSVWANYAHRDHGSLTYALGAIKLALQSHENRIGALYRFAGKTDKNPASAYIKAIRS